ncbi:hypothetical protein CR513_01540, partial [Mucuna pruriens]
MDDPKQPHLDVAYRVLRYLKSAPSQDILLSSNDSLTLRTYCDMSSHLMIHHRFYCVPWILTYFLWSKKQTIVSRSSTDDVYPEGRDYIPFGDFEEEKTPAVKGPMTKEDHQLLIKRSYRKPKKKVSKTQAKDSLRIATKIARDLAQLVANLAREIHKNETSKEISCLIMQPFNKLGSGKPFIINTIRQDRSYKCPIIFYNPSIEPHKPMKAFTFPTVLGAGQSWMAFTFSSSILTPWEPTTKSRKRQSSNQDYTE